MACTRMISMSCEVLFLLPTDLHASSSRHDDSRVSELNILSLAFLFVDAHNHCVAILHLDHNQNLHLLARDLILSERELSPEPSLLLPQTIVSSSALALTEAPPSLVTVPYQQLHGTEETVPGGVLVLGGRKIRFFELSSEEWQEKYRGRRRKLQSQKKANRSPEGKAKDNQKGREIKKRKAKATVEWPWCEVTAYVSYHYPNTFTNRFQVEPCERRRDQVLCWGLLWPFGPAFIRSYS
jgi:DNA damage-binding protein 1